MTSVLAALTISLAPAAGPFELKDGDRVVLVGNALIEREQRYGHWEAALTAAWPDRTVTFRNLGWSGDTVFGEARAGFGSPADGFKKLVKDVLDLKPTVIIVGYGGVEAFDGPAGLPRFEKGLNALLDALAPAKARIVLLSPAPHEDRGRPLPDPAGHNAHLALYRDAIRAIADRRGAHFVDLFALLGTGTAQRDRLTDNGIHLTADGYRMSAAVLLRGLGARLVEPPEALRKAVVAKNEQFFHRWRPQNETYLFGFRKHEQGKNAAEVPLFDPIVEKWEKEIARLRQSFTQPK